MTAGEQELEGSGRGRGRAVGAEAVGMVEGGCPCATWCPHLVLGSGHWPARDSEPTGVSPS